ncbi:efflux RND transporter periplasmic adaptor subunit [Ottowia thiooxydans]|uniref:efflux RND transporter periplasmic adaptor subunit n=1 Tax=Ottowia thiooxydans TaxID=219182 RepID=UPI0003FB2722|nr:efflux RND transporter periplasmic adaptor subunit [Ottowia thiooxydans]
MTDPSSPSGTPAPAPTSVNELLGDDRPTAWWRRPLTWISLSLLLALGAGLWWWNGQQAARAAPVYVTAPLERGDITLTVTANGTLKPTRSVAIGSELSGTVSRVLVDVNDKVKRGQVLLELDRSKFQDTVDRSRAALNAAQATLSLNDATVRETRATLNRFEEVARLSGGRVPSASELDTARATLARAIASTESARAQVTQARASLSTEETNLSKSSIRSPVDGVVLARSVDPGNAVAASLQAVTLFTLGEDLSRLILEASVDEADVGSVLKDQLASFTVSAYPSRHYPAQVARVAYGSTTTNNVVTYTTTLSVDNADLSLRPGMTATATIIATERKGVLVVPNTALRFTPASTEGAAAPARSGGGIMSSMMPRPPGGGARRPSAASAPAAGQARQIWILREQKPVSVTVQTGISDGRRTEINHAELKEGDLVITDQLAKP